MTNQRKKGLPLKDRIFWTNLFQFFVLYIVASLIASILTSPEESFDFDFSRGLGLTAGFCVIWLGVKTALEFANNEKGSSKDSKINLT